MSNITYEEMVRECMVDLREQLELDEANVAHKFGSEVRADIMYQFFLQNWSSIYIRYLQIFRKLELCHDQLLQPQKRADVRILLESCMGRMLEIKHRIIQFCGLYVNFDDVLVDLKLTPESLEVPIPCYFLEDRQQELRARKEMMDALYARYDIDGQGPKDGTEAAAAPVVEAQTAPTNQAPDVLPPGEMTLDKAIFILQCNERGRQGRQRAKFMREIREQEDRMKNALESGSTMDQDPHKAASMIQKIFHGFSARKKAKQLRQEELEFLGMEMSADVRSNAQKDKYLAVVRERKTTQKRNLTELTEDFKTSRNRIKETQGGQIMETMHDEILEKIISQRKVSDGPAVPEFPSIEEGGSLALLKRLEAAENGEEAQPSAAEQEAAAAAAKKAAAKGKAPAKGAKGGKGAKGKGKGKGDEEDAAIEVIGPSLFWSKFKDGTQKYVDVWQDRFNPQDFQQKVDKDILRTEIMDGPGGLTQELRGYVDALVRVELMNLKVAIEGKPIKIKDTDTTKKPKEPTDVKKLELDLNKLVYLNVLQRCPEVKLSEYIGAPNLMGAIMEEHEKIYTEHLEEIKSKWQQLLANWDDTVEKSLHMSKDQFTLLFDKWVETQKNSSLLFEPSMAQVRQTVSEQCILPLGSQIVHDLVKDVPRTVLLYGPPKSGKTMLSHAIATEAGAHYFCITNKILSRENLNLNLQKLVQIVFRIARAQSPSVIVIEDVEKMFNKKAAAGKLNKIKKDMQKCLKELEATDRVLVIGISAAPWEGEKKELLPFFNTMVYTVHPDYASRLLIWKSRIAKYGATLPHDYDYEILAYMTNKYASGTIVKIIDDTLTERRVKRLGQRPLKPDEFLVCLSRAQPIFKETFDKIREFTLALPMHLRMANAKDFVVEETDIDPKKKKGAKGKGGKGKK
eukprot:PhM_4_TR18775/c0_g1_i1/m.58845